MATETLAPDGSVFTLTNLSGAYTDVDESVDSPDGVWLTLGNDGNDSIVRASFPTPTGDPNTGADLQKFRLYVRVGTEAGGNTPTMDVAVRETGGGSDLAVQTGISVTSYTGEVVEFIWDASVLSAADGSAVEIYVTGQRSGGGPSSRRCVEFDAIEWVVDVSAAGTTFFETIAVSSVVSPVLVRVATFPRAVGVTSAMSSVLSRGATFLRGMGVVSVMSPVVGGVAAFVRTISVSSAMSSALSFGRVVERALAVGSVMSGALSRGVTFRQSVAVSSVATVDVSLLKAFSRSLNVLSAMAVSVSTMKAFFRSLDVSSTLTAALALPVTYVRSLSVTSTMVSAVGSAFIAVRSLPAVSAISVSLAKLLILGTGITGIRHYGTELIARAAARTLCRIQRVVITTNTAMKVTFWSGYVDEIQSVFNDASGGTFTLTYSGQTTSALAYNANAVTVRAALELLSTITDVTVTGDGTVGDPWLVTFTDPGGEDLSLMTADDTGLTGDTVGTTVVEVTAGAGSVLMVSRVGANTTLMLPYSEGGWFDVIEGEALSYATDVAGDVSVICGHDIVGS